MTNSTHTQATEPVIGAGVSRTMKALATSTPEKRNKVKILFYGQSIIAQPWSTSLGNRLKEKYPHADLAVENKAIGGFQADRLIRTALTDLYPSYPDLVIFHVYAPGVSMGDWERIIATLRARTTAEILLTTHHASHVGDKKSNYEYDLQSEAIHAIGRKYGCEVVPVRREWQDYMKVHNVDESYLIYDIVHLNDDGNRLMEQLVWNHLRYIPGHSSPRNEWIRRMPVKPDKDGRIKVEFTGNRIDIIAGKLLAGMGTAKLLIDHAPPSANRDAYTFSRVSKTAGWGWWPGISTISAQAPLLLEEWTLAITGIDRRHSTGRITYEVRGSKTGFDGNGDNILHFVSNSGRIAINPNDFQLDFDAIDIGFELKWTVIPMHTDVYIPPVEWDKSRDTATTVTQLIENGPHTLEIIPNGDGTVPIKEVVVYQPPTNGVGFSWI